MEYKFKYSIVNEDDNVCVSGWTYLNEFTSTHGENESVDMEVGKALRNFLVYKKALEAKLNEPDDFTGAGDPLENDR